MEAGFFGWRTLQSSQTVGEAKMEAEAFAYENGVICPR